MRWLTGFESSNALAVVSAHRAWLITDFRYQSVAEEVVDSDMFEIVIDADLLGVAASKAIAIDATTVLLARDRVTLADDAKLATALSETGITRTPGGRLIDGLRQVKTAAEIEAVAAAQQLADEAFREWCSSAASPTHGARGGAAAGDRDAGARSGGHLFAPIVAAGAHGALPHAHPRDVEIPKDELVVIDWGAQLDGYASDCTRTVATGAIDERRKAVHEIVRGPGGGAGRDPRRRAGQGRRRRGPRLIDGEGYGEYFGHGLGMAWALRCTRGRRSRRAPKTSWRPATSSPWSPALPAGEFGVRVEELVVVTDWRAAHPHGLPREPLVVG